MLSTDEDVTIAGVNPPACSLILNVREVVPVLLMVKVLVTLLPSCTVSSKEMGETWMSGAGGS